MVIASIDLKGGHVVQLKNGKDLILQRDDADTLISEFNLYGEVAIIDLDAALGNTDEKGKTANTDLLKSLLRKGNVRVGGGIRSVKKARELISLGAEKVIIGSAAWNTKRENSDSILNTEFLDELVAAIGKQRIIISVHIRIDNPLYNIGGCLFTAVFKDRTDCKDLAADIVSVFSHFAAVFDSERRPSAERKICSAVVSVRTGHANAVITAFCLVWLFCFFHHIPFPVVFQATNN